MDFDKLRAPFSPERVSLFMAKVQPEPNSGCWLWDGSANKQGYGNFWHAGHCWKAHRFAYRAFVGPLQSDQDVMHKCDMPSCVNPDHLKAGTTLDNIRDMYRKGRAPSRAREANSRSLLTPDGVQRIRDMAALSYPTVRIAALFRVSTSQIRRVVTRRYGGWQ